MSEDLTNIKTEELFKEEDALSSEYVKCFESSYSKFMNEFGDDEHEAKRKIEDMIDLLNVNDKNLDKLKNEKWFQKIWYTISGGNRKLRNINNHNLIKIQKGTLYFLDKFANENRTIMQSVHFALDKIKELRFENEKVKYYLADLSTKIKYKIDNIETRLDEHKMEIDSIKNNNISYIFAGSLTLIGVLLIIFMNEYLIKWILGSLCIIVAIIMLIQKRYNYLKVKNIYSKKYIVYNNISINNSKILKLLYSNIYKYFDNIISNLVYIPYEQLANNYQELEKIITEVSNHSELTRKENLKYVRKYLDIETISILNIKLGFQNVISQLIDEYNKFILSIIQEYLPESINLEILNAIDFQDQNNLQIELNDAINPYDGNFKSLESLRITLSNDFFRVKEIEERSLFLDGVKHFFAGASLIGIPFILAKDNEEEEFVNKFFNSLESYSNEWANVIQIVINSICEIQKRDCNNFIRTIIEKKFNYIVDEFNLKGISITNLNCRIEEIIKENTVNNNVSSEK